MLDWLAQSLDLNPIEHLWFLLKRGLNEYDTEPKGMKKLLNRVITEWNKITPEDCSKLIESMSNRIRAVIKAKGLWTDY